MAYKNENQIYADIISLCNNGLAWCDIAGFTVRRGGQVLNVRSLEPTILVTRLSSNQYAFQFPKGRFVNNEYVESQCFIQDLRFNIRGLKKRAGTQQTADVFTCEDAIRGLMSYFQSLEGIKACYALGYSVIKPKENPEPFYISDSDQYEKSPSFDLILPIIQSFDKVIGTVTEFEGTVTEISGIIEPV